MTRRTYWHLESRRKVPTDYEIATSALLYHVGRGIEVTTPIGTLWERHPSRLSCPQIDAFVDPRETTYSAYTRIQSEKEIFVDRLLASVDDSRLSQSWLDALEPLLGPLRFPVHGLQMVAAYVGSTAPSGRVAVACAFQAADEMRRVQRIAQRTVQLRRLRPGFAEDAQARWLADPAWQPLRRLVEELLVVYDWAEAFVALALAVKPSFDELVSVRLRERARAASDDVLEKMLASLVEDAEWHQQWAAALSRVLVAGAPENAELVDTWKGAWSARAAGATQVVASILDGARHV